MNGNNRTNLFQKLVTLMGVASAGTLLSLPAMALPSDSMKISEAPVNSTIYSQTQTEEPDNITPGTQQQYPGTTTTPGTQQQYPGTTTTPGTQQQYPGTTTTPGTQQQYPGTTTTPGTQQQYPGTTNDVTQPNYDPARPQQTTDDDGTTGVQDTDGGVRALW
jgi:hypothetical protein